MSENSIVITHLSFIADGTPDRIVGKVPFLSVNCTFRVNITGPESESLFKTLKTESEEFYKTTTVDDPEKFKGWVLTESIFSNNVYGGLGEVWVLNEPYLKYLSKFETFHYRDCIADSPVTRSILKELAEIEEKGDTFSVYRNTSDSIFVKHLKALSLYWD